MTCRRDVLGELKGDRALCPAVAGGQDKGRVFHTQQEARLVEVTTHVVLSIVANEVVGNRDVRRQAHRVLDVEFLQGALTSVNIRHQFNVTIATYSFGNRRVILVVRPAINPNAREVRRGVHIRAVRLEEALEV